MRHVEHDVAGAPTFVERLQLILEVFGLLSGQPRDWIIPVITLTRPPVAVLTVLELPAEVSSCTDCRVPAAHPGRGWQGQCEQDEQRYRPARANRAHRPARPLAAFFSGEHHFWIFRRHDFDQTRRSYSR